MVVNAYINEDGSAHIQEIWDMNVNEGTEVYKVFDNMGASQISNLQVKDENGLVYRNIGEWDVNASRTEKMVSVDLLQRRMAMNCVLVLVNMATERIRLNMMSLIL